MVDVDLTTPAVDTTMDVKKELQKEFRRLVESISVNGDEFEIKVIEELVLKISNVLKAMETDSVLSDSVAIPDQFRCPISKQLMSDPVVLSTGVTCDRRQILNRLNQGNISCPVMNQSLSHTILTPNILVRELIANWCIKNQIAIPKPIEVFEEEIVTDSKCVLLRILLEKMSSPLSVQKEVAKELRLLTKTMWFFRPLFGELPDALTKLLSPLSPGMSDAIADSDLHEDLVTTLLNISIPHSNRKFIGEDPIAVPFLIDSLKGKTSEIKRNAAAALFSLSSLDSNKHIIGNLGAMKPLIDILKEGHLLPMKDAAKTIYNLCILSENKSRAIRHGAIETVLDKIKDQKLVREMLAILARLSYHAKAVDEMCRHGAVGCLLNFLQESDCESEKECCAAILYTIYSQSKLRQVRDEDEDDDDLCSYVVVADRVDNIEFTVPAKSPMFASFTSSDGR